MMKRREIVMIVVAGLLSEPGCAARPFVAKGPKIVVREFVASDAATTVRNYSAPYDSIGNDIARQVAAALVGYWERDAVFAPAGADAQGDLVVSGRVTQIDGGSRGARITMSLLLGFGFTNYGVGGSSLAVEGEVARADGTRLGTFQEQVKRGGSGWFWIRYGESSSRQISYCIDWIAYQVAEVVNERRYLRSNTYTPADAATTRTAAERLKELQGLHEQGLITDAEYQEKRRRIMEEF